MSPPLLGGVGFLAWLLLTDPGIPQALLGLGVLVIVPLGVNGRTAWAALPCGGLLIGAMGLPQGPLAASLALPWLALTAVLSVGGVLRILRRGGQDPTELCFDLGHALVLVGGVWAALDRLGAQPLGYDPLLVLLTAVHFHFAGFALPLLAGHLGRHRPGGTPWWIALGLLLGVPLVAGGLVISQVTGWTGAEWLPSWLLALTGMGVAVGQLRQASLTPRGVPLALSSLALLVGMFMAGAWGLARAFRLGWPTMIDMFRLHGLLNAVGFSLLGLLARCGTSAAPPLPDPPLTGMRGTGRIGTGWFLRAGIADPNAEPPPGQLDRLEDLAGPDLDPGRVDAEVRRFYEHTADYDLIVRPRWSAAVAPLARIAVRLLSHAGQVVLPLEPTWQRVRVHIHAAAPHDGPADLRLYERTYEDGRPMFIAAYATFRTADRGCLAVALPLPFAGLVSVMAMENAEDGGVRLGTTPRFPGAQTGFFLALGPLLIRLPVHEHLRIVPGEELTATQRVSLLGATLLTMDYRLPRYSSQAPVVV